MVDGASVLGVFRRVMLPLAIPGVVTVVLYSFLFGWNEFLAALMLISSSSRLHTPGSVEQPRAWPLWIRQLGCP